MPFSFLFPTPPPLTTLKSQRTDWSTASEQWEFSHSLGHYASSDHGEPGMLPPRAPMAETNRSPLGEFSTRRGQASRDPRPAVLLSRSNHRQ
jgi:hypothetical protein